MKLEQAKSQILPGVVTPSKKQAPAKAMPLQAKAATPAQLQRAKTKLEQDRSQIQRQAEQASIQRETRAASQEQARVQRQQDQAVALEQQSRLQRLADTQARQQNFFSSFVKSPVQRKSQQQVKTSSVQTAQARDQYQAAVQPEILQRLVDDRISLQSKQARATQPKNDLNARAEWFNTELPVLRAKHNHPDTPFLDAANVFKPADQQAFALGKTYGIQRLASGLTPKDAASAILNIQRKADRDIAMRGLLTGVNPRQSDYTSIQRLVAQGETKLELQRRALLEDPAIQSQALQLAKDEAHPTSPSSGISDKIKTKLGAGNPLPENVRQQLEMGLNTDLSSVRVHTDSEADFLSKSVQAKAFTTGNDIFFSSGAFDPNTKSGYELIAHETTHTVQQASGQVQPGIDSDPSLETAAQTKGAELASGFNPNFKYKNLENQAQPNSPLIASQPPAHRAKIQAMQRSSLPQHQILQREPQAPSSVVAPTVIQTLDETALATLTTALLPVVPQKYQADAQSNIPVILKQCFASQIKNANQVAYILATAQHESRFGTKMYSRSESLVEDHNPLQTEHRKVKDKKTKKTHVEDIPYRSNHVTGHRVNADPSNTDNLDTYYDDAYGGRLGNVKGSSDAANYRGRGFVQITGRDNYKRLGKQIQAEGFSYTFDGVTYGTKEQPIDLVANPTHVNLVPELAAKIMVSGMQNDSFAQGGKGLSTYVNDKTTDFVGARGLVNGIDRAADIAKIAEDFAKILNTDNAWGNLFKTPDLTKPSTDISKPGVTPGQTMQRSALSLQRDITPPSKAHVHNMTYDTLLEAMAVNMGYKDELDQQDKNLLKQFGYSWSENNIGESGLQLRLFYPSQKSYPYAVLAFRGTEAGLNAEGARDIIADVDPIGPGHSQWRDNKAMIKRTLEYAVERTRSRAWVTGHSLGGAIAQYAGANFPDLVGRIITFQAPAITGRDVNELENHNRAHPKRRVNSTHYEVEGDLVPTSPHFNPIGRNLRNIALGGVRKTPGALTTFKTKYGDTLSPLEAHMATPLYNQLQITSPEAYAPFERNGFRSNNEFYPTQRARATGATSSVASGNLVIQASRDTSVSPQTLERTPTFAIQNIQRQAQAKAPLISSQPVLQRSSLSLQREQGLPETLTPQGRTNGAVLIASAAKGKPEKETIENAKVPINKSVNSRKKLQIETLVFYGFDRTLAETYTNTDGDFNYRNVSRIITKWRELTEEDIKRGFVIVEVSDFKKLREQAQLANVQFKANPRNAPLPGLAVAYDYKGVKMHPKTDTNSEVIRHYPYKSLLFVEEVAGAPTWFKARGADGKEGYVAMFLIKVAPEVGSTLYEIGKGQNISDIVSNHYKLGGALNAPERHKIIAALSYLNPQLLRRPSERAGWDKVVTLEGLIWLPSKAFIGTLRGFNINDSIGGDFTDGAASVVKAGMDTLAETGEYVVKNVLKQFPGGQRVMDKLGEIGTGVSAIYNNPGRFVDTLCKSVNDGFGLFTKNLPENLQNSAISVITGSLSGTGLVLPKNLDATGFLDIGLQVLGVSPQQLENKVAKGVPGGLQAIQAVGEAKNVFDGIRNNGVVATIKSYYENSEGIQQVIINGLKSWAINTVAKKAIAVLGSLFIPGGGLVQLAIKIYDTITFILDKMEMIRDTLTSITKSFASIANGDASQATTGIVNTLKGGLTLALGFMVKISGLGGITDKVKKLLADLRAPVDKAIANLIKFIKGKLSGRTKPVTGAPAAAPKPGDRTNSPTQTLEMSFEMNGVEHTLYVSVGSSAEVEMASRRDRMSNKIGRAVAALLQSGVKEDDPKITELRAVGKTASNVQKNAKAATPSSSVTAKSIGLTKLAAEIRTYGKKYKVTDIDSSIVSEKTLQGGSRVVNVRGQKWNLPPGKTEKDIPKSDPIGDQLQAAATRYGSQWSTDSLSENEKEAIKKATEKAKADGSWWKVNLLKNQAKGRWVEKQLKEIFTNLDWRSIGVDVFDVKTNLNYDILLGSAWNINEHAQRMPNIMFRYISF
jgi:predicted chitinase/pimeloyl-ACP methyl ester carboxylesterase